MIEFLQLHLTSFVIGFLLGLLAAIIVSSLFSIARKIATPPGEELLSRKSKYVR